jgi:prepilin signal peptidase PulO-like enzyme (type II secretory pathway)
MKAYWVEWRYSSTHSLTSELDGGEWSASRHGRFTPRERVPGTHWIGGWVGPRAFLNAVVNRKIPSPHRTLEPRSSSPALYRLSYRGSHHYWQGEINFSFIRVLQLFRSHLFLLSYIWRFRPIKIGVYSAIWKGRGPAVVIICQWANFLVLEKKTT